MSALTDAALAEAAAARIMGAAAHGDGKSRWLVDADAVRDLAYLTPKLVAELRTSRDTNAAASDNRRDAWAALAMIREALETLGPVGVLPSEEAVSTRPEHGHLLDEGAALVEGIRRIAQERDAARAEGFARGVEAAAREADADDGLVRPGAPDEGPGDAQRIAKTIRALTSAGDRT